MVSSTIPDTPGQEPMAWFTSTMKEWISFTYLDEYLRYVVWWLLYMPAILALLFCLIVYISICIVSFSLYIYKKINNAPENILNKIWDNPRYILSYMGSTLGKIIHGYEIIGMENIPEGPGIIILYHGTLCYDLNFFVANFFLQRGRVCHSVVENHLYALPGLTPFFQLCGCIPGDRAKSLEILKKGQLLGIAPGGVREALFSDQYYKLIWGNRTGFAQVALEAKVPIIPMFTRNIREVNRPIGNIRFIRWLYEKTRWLFPPVTGYLPVKLCTYIGEPIPYDPNTTAQELAEKTKIAIENLRDKHQQIPGHILRALSERFQKHHKEN